MPLKIRIQQTKKGFTGYLSNKVYKAPTRQGVIDLAMKEWLAIEDLPKIDIDPLMMRIRHIIEQCPTSSLYDLFCYERDRWDFDNWHDNDAFLKFIEDNHAVEPEPEAGKSEDLITVLEALGFRSDMAFEVLAYLVDEGDAHWILNMSDLYYYVASLRHVTFDDQLYYYERTKEYASNSLQSNSLQAVSYAPKVGRYSKQGVYVKVNLTRQLLGEQHIGEVDYTLTGDEK